MVSVVIVAHNEESALGETLGALLGDGNNAEVIVVPNGCSDGTADVARSFPGVHVIELDQGGKALALNAGDAVATSFPRVYLDADILVPAGALQALEVALAEPGIVAAVPGRVLDTNGRPWPVRAYFAINERLPVYRNGLFGRGMIALSEAGRGRFADFPLMVADDLFVDSLYSSAEKAHVDDVQVVVKTPLTTRDLYRRLIRVRRGTAAMRRASASGEIKVAVRPADRWAWLREVVAHDLRLLPAGIAYAAITLAAAAAARRGPVNALDWGRDGSTRR